MLPVSEPSCQLSNLTWVDSISSRRDDIRCRFELKCQLQSGIKPQMNTWLCFTQSDGIKEQGETRRIRKKVGHDQKPAQLRSRQATRQDKGRLEDIMEGQAPARRASEDVADMEKPVLGLGTARRSGRSRGPARCSLRTRAVRQISPEQQGVRGRQLCPSGWRPAPAQPCQALIGRSGIKSAFRGMLRWKMAELRS